MKPMKLFLSPLTLRVYASRSYKYTEDGKYCIITGAKYDVTEDFNAVRKEMEIYEGHRN